MEIRKLNMLRGIAALNVVVSHYSNETGILWGALGHGAGQFGVMLFFMLSGFLMSYLYLNIEFNITNIQNYAVARIARVIPLFLFVVLMSYFFQVIGIKGVLYDIQNLKSLISNLALLSGTSVLWTIGPEIQFYIFFIFLWFLTAKRTEYLYIFISFVLLLLIFFDFPNPQVHFKELSIDTKLIRSLPYFFAGVVFASLYKKWTPPNHLQSSAFLLTLLIIPLFYPIIFHFITGKTHEMWADFGLFFSFSLVFFALVFLVPHDNKFLSNYIGDFLGKISYSLYLLHLPILNLLKNPAKAHPMIFLVVFITISLLISYLSYWLLENPLRKFIRSMASNKAF